MENVYKINFDSEQQLTYILDFLKMHNIDLLRINKIKKCVLAATEESSIEDIDFAYEKLLGNKELYREKNKKRILVFHGLGGGENSKANRLFKFYFGNEYDVCAPEIPIRPELGSKLCEDLVNYTEPSLVVGTSLGGFYTYRYVKDAPMLLINPSLEPYDDFMSSPSLKKGVHEYHQTRNDGEKTFVIDDTFLESLHLLQEENNSINKKRNIINIYSIFGTNDQLFSHINDFKEKYLENNMRLIEGGEHSLSETLFIEHVIPYAKAILEWINLETLLKSTNGSSCKLAYDLKNKSLCSLSDKKIASYEKLYFNEKQKLNNVFVLSKKDEAYLVAISLINHVSGTVGYIDLNINLQSLIIPTLEKYFKNNI